MKTPYESATELGLQPLPDASASLLNQYNAPPRLIAHLIVAHHVAVLLVSALRRTWPALTFDPYRVQIGAAVHDIGKLRIQSELVSSGDAHEEAGYELLLEQGIDPQIARFARTHSTPSETAIEIEDLLVALADRCATDRRDGSLEDLTVRLLAARLGSPSWEVFSALDGILTEIHTRTPELLAWQSSFPT